MWLDESGNVIAAHIVEGPMDIDEREIIGSMSVKPSELDVAVSKLLAMLRKVR